MIRNRLLLAKNFIKFWIKTLQVMYSEATLYFLSFSELNERKFNKQKLIAKIISLYHVIEKGLTMPDMKVKFGYETILHTIDLCEFYLSEYKKIDEHVIYAIKMLQEYISVHNRLKINVDESITDRINKLFFLVKNNDIPGKIAHELVTSASFFSKTKSEYPEFVRSRHSIRSFSGDNISLKEIENALEIADFTPTSCNRQPARVKIIENKKIINEVLNIQRGNRGFGHLVNKLIIVYADMSIYNDVVERNTIYIDTGMYTMNLLLALHYHKIGVCTLNASFTLSEEKQVKEKLGMSRKEVISVILACGRIPNEVKYANSPKTGYLQKYDVL